MSFTPLIYRRGEFTLECYVCAKCGGSTLEDWFEKLDDVEFSGPPKKYSFLVTRNPFIRLYSFYSDKIVKRNFVKKTGNLLFLQESSRFGSPGEVIEGCSFRTLVNAIYEYHPQNRLEAHLEGQVEHLGLGEDYQKMFDSIVRLESFRDDMAKVCNEINIPAESILEMQVGASNKVSGDFENVSDLVREDFLKLGGVPEDYMAFYDDDIRRKVEEVYKNDLRLLGYKFGEKHAT